MKKQQTTGLHGAAKDVPTIVAQASDKISGFRELIQELDRSLTINGKSRSTYDNYSRQLAHLADHYNQNPLELSAQQVTDYLYQLKKDQNVSKSFFRFTVFGMRYVCKMKGLSYEQCIVLFIIYYLLEICLKPYMLGVKKSRLLCTKHKKGKCPLDPTLTDSQACFGKYKTCFSIIKAIRSSNEVYS